MNSIVSNTGSENCESLDICDGMIIFSPGLSEEEKQELLATIEKDDAEEEKLRRKNGGFIPTEDVLDGLK